MKLTVLVDNYVQFSMGLKGEHGFSLFIEKKGEHFLFDTGQSGICVDNAKTLGIDLADVKKIVLSHGHYDHTGGLTKVLDMIKGNVEIIAHPSMFEKKFVTVDDAEKKEIFIGASFTMESITSNYLASFILKKGFSDLGDGMWLTGEVPLTNDYELLDNELKSGEKGCLTCDNFADDNSLVLDTGQGLVVVLGCAHRGMVNICEYVKLNLGRPIYGIIGGAHLFRANDKHVNFVREFLAKNDIKLFAPSHCTGINNIMAFSSEFPDMVKPAFVGSSFEF